MPKKNGLLSAIHIPSDMECPPGETYPEQTTNWLKANGIIGIKDPQIIATSGWTTVNLQAAIASQNPAGPFDAVSILIGVNDQYQGADTAGYRIRFTQLVAAMHFPCQ